MIGGGDGRGALGDVWRLALNNEVKWTKVCDGFSSTNSDRPWRAWGHSAVGLEGRDDLVVLFGGASNSGQVFRATNDVELLQITEKGARALVHAAEGQPPPAVYRHSCTPLGGDRFLVAGGYTFAPSISSAAARKSNFRRVVPVTSSARWRGASTPSTRGWLHSCVYSMEFRLKNHCLISTQN